MRLNKPRFKVNKFDSLNLNFAGPSDEKKLRKLRH